jgi:hypothetical protein
MLTLATVERHHLLARRSMGRVRCSEGYDGQVYIWGMSWTIPDRHADTDVGLNSGSVLRSSVLSSTLYFSLPSAFLSCSKHSLGSSIRQRLRIPSLFSLWDPSASRQTWLVSWF